MWIRGDAMWHTPIPVSRISSPATSAPMRGVCWLLSIISASGLLFDPHVPLVELAAEGHKHVSCNGFTETSGTVGRYLCAVRDGYYDGLISLGSFNCQPAMNAQTIIRPLAGVSELPYVSLDCEGPWISTNQRRLLEAVAVQARRVREERAHHFRTQYMRTNDSSGPRGGRG